MLQSIFVGTISPRVRADLCIDDLLHLRCSDALGVAPQSSLIKVTRYMDVYAVLLRYQMSNIEVTCMKF
jgi:hypothetical protein